MKFNESPIEITERNFETAFPREFSNSIFTFRSAKTIGDTYTSGYSFKYVYKGIENYLIDENPVTIHPGQGLFVNSGSQIKVQSRGQSISLFFDERLMSTLCRDIFSQKQPYIFDCIPVSNLPIIIEKELASLVLNPHAKVQDSFYYDLARLVIINQLNTPQGAQAGAKKAPKKKPDYLIERLEVVRSLLSDVYNSASLDYMAKESAISKWHMTRSFRDVYGITPVHLRILCKISKAEEMLMENIGSSVKIIATHLGYPDIYSFSKQFKQVTGRSPIQYRSTQRVIF